MYLKNFFSKLELLSILLVIDVMCEAQSNETTVKCISKTYEYDKIIYVVVNDTTEQLLSFIETSDKWLGYPTRVHISINETIDSDHPVFITAAQQRGAASWQLPAPGAAAGASMARTLCPHDEADADDSAVGEVGAMGAGRPRVSVGTRRASNVTVAIKLRRVTDFYVQPGKEVELSVTPATPKYYLFSFDDAPSNTSRGLPGLLPRFNHSVPKSVILSIESPDPLCALVSIQNNSCPVLDSEREVRYQGYRLTMSSRGGITLTQAMFPKGFYIVFVVKGDDEACTGSGAGGTGAGTVLGEGGAARNKTFRFRVVGTISYVEYLQGAGVMLALVLLIAMLAPLTVLACGGRAPAHREEVMVEDAAGAGPSTAALLAEEAPIISPRRDRGACSDNCTAAEASLSRSGSLQEERGGGAEPWAPWAAPLTVAGLCRASPGAHARRSDRYFWSALTVAVVYSLPVLQLLLTYQRMVYQTGDQDLCYYNFLCAHPLGLLADFNHVYSNVGYVVLGLAFMLQVRCRQRRAADHAELGIPQHAGLSYSMGLALLMEGLLSACYHLCPNKMNFQFDSSFMYVTAALCMVKLYQSRHADVNASAHSTFMLLAAVMAIGLVGIMYPSVYYWALLTALHLATCLVLTLKIYYVGDFTLDGTVGKRAWAAVRRVAGAGGTAGAGGAEDGGGGAWGRARAAGRALRPRHGARALLLALANLANWALAGHGLYSHSADVARHLLAVLVGNALLYALFYFAMKLQHRERVPPHTWACCAAALAAWALAVVYFLDSKTKWSETPAQSRRHNAACSVLQFYDSHDTWHLASAAAMFFSFNALLTVDDALRDTPRHLIPVF